MNAILEDCLMYASLIIFCYSSYELYVMSNKMTSEEFKKLMYNTFFCLPISRIKFLKREPHAL